MVEAAFDLAVTNPQLWTSFVKAYSDYTVGRALDMAHVGPDKLSFAQGGLFFLKQQTEVFGDIHRHRQLLDEERKRRLAKQQRAG